MATTSLAGHDLPATGRVLSRPHSPRTPPPTIAPDVARLHYVDVLRIGAIVLVFLVHVAEVFNPWDEWHIANPERSRIIGEIAVLAAPWSMPLLMLLAGVSAWYSLARRDNGAYIRDRLLRVLLPLVVGVLVLVPPQVYLERRFRGQFDGSFIAFYPHFFTWIYPKGNLSWHHLWFLAHLFVYSLLALPLFWHWQRSGGRATMRWAARVCGAPGGILWLALPLIVERHLLWGMFPERHMLTSDWSNHALLFVAFIYGFLLAGSPLLGRVIDMQWRRALVIGVLGTLVLFAGTWRDVVPWRLPPPYSMPYLVFWTVYAVCAWAWMVGLLGVARRWLDRERAFVRYGRRTGYAIYVLHQPVIIGAAYVVVPLHVATAVKFGLILAASASATLLGVEVLASIPLTRAALGLGGPRASASGAPDTTLSSRTNDRSA